MVIFKIALTVIVATTPYSPSVSEVKSDIRKVSGWFESIGIDLQVGRIIKIRDGSKRLKSIKRLIDRRSYWRQWKDRHNVQGYVYVSVGPFCDDIGCRITVGVSEQVCLKDGLALGGGFVAHGANNRLIRADTMAHEVAHLLGASHIWGGLNIMNPALMTQSGKENLYFEQQSREEIEQCLTK